MKETFQDIQAGIVVRLGVGAMFALMEYIEEYHESVSWHIVFENGRYTVRKNNMRHKLSQLSA